MPRNTPPSLISYTELAYNVIHGTSGVATASVSWQTGDVIAVLCGDEGIATESFATPTATGLTFTAQKTHTASSSPAAGVWTAVAASTSSSTITCQDPGTNAHWGASVWVWRGSDGVGTSFVQATSTKTVSATPTDTHSAFMWGVFDWGAGAPSTSVLTPTVTNTRAGGTSGGGTQLSTFYTYWVGDEDDQASSSATSYGITSGDTSTGPYVIIGVEVLGTTTGGSTGLPDLIMAPPHR